MTMGINAWVMWESIDKYNGLSTINILGVVSMGKVIVVLWERETTDWRGDGGTLRWGRVVRRASTDFTEGNRSNRLPLATGYWPLTAEKCFLALYLLVVYNILRACHGWRADTTGGRRMRRGENRKGKTMRKRMFPLTVCGMAMRCICSQAAFIRDTCRNYWDIKAGCWVRYARSGISELVRI